MIITVEGNIGAGKTTFATALYDELARNAYPVEYIPEPVGAWTDFHGDNLLEKMYGDRERWSFAFQVNALLHMTRCDRQAVDRADKGLVVVRERSSFSARTIFKPIVSEFLSPAERVILDELCNTVPDPCSDRTSDLTIYMRTDPQTCFQRVTARGRAEESKGRVDLPYLVRLHEMHELVVAKPEDSRRRLLVTDGNAFDAQDPKSVEIVGGGGSVYDTITSLLPKAVQ